ncbi:hypothetical protein NKI36_06395 [Mesorhizobium caraganae]|uniref:DNA mismatch repair protein MutS-like N-terminal domain-containing protein n=1 Tax=Mesorhizobium caraganae TaxID=483206 RepID=A0ABV1YV91_9HYPH
MKVILQLNGEFLEAYGNDAEAVAKALSIVLATRGNAPMAGISVHRRDKDFAALRAVGIEPHEVEREAGLKAVWRRTRQDFKGTVDGKRTVVVFRDSVVLVPLDDLRPDEIARLYPREELSSA